MKPYIALLALSATTSAFTTHAQANPEPIQLAEVTLVTATRSESALEDTLAPASVFNREDIERLQAQDLNQVLAYVPGADLAQTGGYGSTASLYLRGTDSEHTLFLLDGQRFSSATLGTANFQFISPDHIERVEIVRGPRSSVYGSDAIGGVVQVFTKRGSEEPEAYVRLGAGSHNAYESSAGGGFSHNGFHAAGNVSYFDTDGFDNYVDTTPPNDDDDGYRNRTVSFNLGYDVSDDLGVNLNYLHAKSRNEHDGTYNPEAPYSDNWIQTIQLSVNAQPVTDIWSMSINLGQSTDDSDNLDSFDDSEHTHFRTKRESADWINTFSIGEPHTLIVGLETYEDEVSSTTIYTDASGNSVDSRYNHAAFAVYQLNHSVIDLQLGARQDDNEEFGEHTTANASVGLHINEAHQIIASYGEGFKAPTFNDLYWPITAYSFGNPDLESEESESYEVEVRGHYTQWQWALSVYQTKIENLIDWAPVDPTDPLSPYTPSNVDDVSIDGVELSSQATIAGLDIAATLSYTDATDDATGNQLTNRAKKSATLIVDKHFERWSVGSTLRAYSKRYGDISNSSSTPGYAVVDVYTRWAITEQFSAELKLNNIFDRDYQNREGYNQDDFNWFVSLKYSL